MRLSPWLVLVFAAAIGGFVFASFSTYDFVAHLDRQVHGIHCSFIPGIEGTDASGATDCHVTLMSPYSSVLRTSVWGGIPVSLPAMGVFAFLAFAAVFLTLTGRNDTKSAWFLVAATGLPVLTSIGMGYLSLVTLDAACKMCIGIYAASGLAFIAALGFAFSAHRAGRAEGGDGDREPASLLALAVAFVIGVAFVAAPVAAYASSAPDFERYVGACGELSKLEIADGVLVPLGQQGGGTEVIEVLDPLCAACRGFERRFEAADFASSVSRRALLFPLDSECNWMIGDSIHPGACAVSEAILCADDRAEQVLTWAFEQQDAIREAAEHDPEAAARMVSRQFPFVADCVGTPTVRARLNLALRFAVDNQMPIITPQIYVGGTRLCDEDTDLGMDFALSRLLSQTGADAPRVETVEAAGLVAREVEREAAPQPTIRRTPPPVEAVADAGVDAIADAEGAATPEPLDGTGATGETVEAAVDQGEAAGAVEGAGEAVAAEEPPAEPEPEPTPEEEGQ